MLENELLQFQQELGAIKRDLLNNTDLPGVADEESYIIATKLDLAVARLLRLLE